MRMLDRKLEIFRTAARLKHFSEAAEALGMSQPNVTQQIARLEREFGMPLFDRTGRTLELTTAGEALQKECESLFQEAGEIHRRVVNAQPGMRFYRIGGTLTAGGFVLPELAARYMERHPRHNLELRVANTRDIVESLKLRTLDLALVEGPVSRELFYSEPLMTDRLIPVGAAGAIAPVFPLGEYLRGGGRFVLREPGSGTRYYFDRFLREHGLPAPAPERTIVADNFDAIKHLVRGGHGITVISELAVETELRDGELTGAVFAEGEIVRPIHFIYPPYENLRFAERFIAFCREKSH